MKPYAYSTFCDDIRHEVNGKTSYIGTFNGSLFLPSLPAMIPKLCCIVSLVLPLEEHLSDLKISCLFAGSEVFANQFGADQLKGLYGAAPTVEDRKGFLAQFMISLSPFNVESFGKLQIEIFADGEQIECPGLQISQAPEGMVLM